jgi:hypothetical protein
MELFRGTAPTVKFYLPATNATVQNVTYTKNGVSGGVLQHGQPVNGAVSVRLPYLQYDGVVTVDWTFLLDNQSYTETVHYEVITPLLTDRDIKTIHPNGTEEEIDRIESAVRHIIQAHTGQRFGKFVGIYDVRGNADRTLNLPARLVELTSVNGMDEDPNKYFAVEQGGWVLRHFPWGVPPVKADYYGLHMHVGGVIHNPNLVRLGEWNDGRYYAVSGVWGYNSVPMPVQEAARLLVNDYACGDAAYRDRYLTSMTAADWRIQFHDGAFQRTGNVRADQLLADYVLASGMAVI